MIQVCNLSFANSSITDTLGNYSHLTTGNITDGRGGTYPANTDPVVYVTDSSLSCIEFGQTATYSNGAIIQAGIPDYGSENWAVEFRARVTSAMPEYDEWYVIFYGLRAPYDDNGTIRTGGHWSIAINNSLNELEFSYVDHYDSLTIKDNLDFTSWHLYKVTKTAEEILTLHIDNVLVATIDLEQQIGYKTHATLGSFALLGDADAFPTDNRIQTNQSIRLADVKVYADPMGHAEKAVSLDNLSRVFRNYNTWLGSQLSGKANSSHTHTKSEITDFPAYGNTAGTICEGNDSRLSGISDSDIDDIADDAGFSSGSLPASEDIFIDGDIIPNTDNSVDVGASSKNFKMIYTKGITINGTQFLPSDYATLSGLSTVATSGSYNDLSNKPTIPTTTSDLTNDSGFLTLESLSTNSIAFHNSYPRCKYLGTTITDAQNTAIKNRTYDDLFIGDYWTINGVNWRIVAIDYYYNIGDPNFNKGNVIVMPDTVLYTAQMNETNTTAGAYAGSLMRTQNLNNARTIAQNAFGSHLVNHKITLANSVNASGPNSWSWYDSDGVELPNEVQIYGTRIWGSALKGFDVSMQKQQFPLLALAPQFVNIRKTYWLQDVSSNSVSSLFASVNYLGYADYSNASLSIGVRPSVTLSYI